jgi:hypothetical protein
MSKKTLAELVKKALNECGEDTSCGCGCPDEKSNNQEPFYRLAPDVVGSINNFRIYPEKNMAAMGFGTSDGNKFNLIVPSETVYNWMDAGGEDAPMTDFVKSFLSVSKPNDNVEVGGGGGEEEMLGEIVDEDGNLIGDEDRPPNATFRQVGSSRKGSDQVMKMIVPKSKRYYGDMGLGFITW